MIVSPRARLAWANRNLEAAADIIVADHLRTLERRGVQFNDDYRLADLADELDPEGVQS